jgi:hypothetical protein
MLKSDVMVLAALLCVPVQCIAAPASPDIGWKIAQAQSPAPPAAKSPATQAPARPGSPSPTQQGPDVKQLGEELQKYVEERARRLDEIGKSIKDGIETEQKANEIYGRFVGTVKDIIERIGPQSDFRKDLDRVLEASRKAAEEFARSPNPKVRGLAKGMTENASQIEKLISDANNEYARGLGVIRDLEDGREEAVAYIRSKALKAAKDAAEQYLGIVRSVIEEANKFGQRTKETAPAF